MQWEKMHVMVLKYVCASFPKMETNFRPLNLGWTSWFSSNEWNVAEVMLCDFWGMVVKKKIASTWFALPWIDHLERGQLPCHELAACGESLVGGNWDPPSPAPEQAPGCACEGPMRMSHFGSGSTCPVKPPVDSAAVNIVSTASWETPNQDHPANPLRSSWPPETLRHTTFVAVLNR